MHNPVEDSISQGRVLNLLMPLVNGKLSGKQRRGFAIAEVKQVEQVSGRRCTIEI